MREIPLYHGRIKYVIKWGAVCLLLAYAILRLLDVLLPPDLSRYQSQSVVVSDKTGRWLQVFLSGDDKRRIATDNARLPDDYLNLLVHYEDKDFYRHNGIDWLAIGRALGQNIMAGRTVSGASTLTMQTAKLLEPRPRTIKSKVIEAFRAWQLERRYSKDDILSMYATLAPMGSNIEGLTSAAHYYLNKPVDKLSLSESAWLVALPQSPARLSRQDGAAGNQAAIRARNKVLKRALDNQVITLERYKQAVAEPLMLTYTPFPMLAPHLASYAKRQHPQKNQIKTAVDGDLQTSLRNVLRAGLSLNHPHINLAGGVLDNRTGEWLAYVGSADFFATQRQGQVDMLRAVRSPGSALKPFITLFAFDWLNYQPQTTIDDTPITGNPYQPNNYDGLFQGRQTLAQALLRSRNVPAIRLLQAIKPAYFSEALAAAGLRLYLPKGARPNLAIGLGGVGVRGVDLSQTYSQLAQCAYQLVPEVASVKKTDDLQGKQLAKAKSCWLITRILRKNHDGEGRVMFGAEPVAFKTGTAYGWRDLWLLAYTKEYTIVLWRGRADGQFAEQKASAEVLMPTLRQVVARLPNRPAADPLPFMHTLQGRLPPRLQHVGADNSNPDGVSRVLKKITPVHQPDFSVAAPLDNATVDFQTGMRLSLSVQGGTPPFIYLLNDELLAQTSDSTIDYPHPLAGSYHLLVVDATGKTAQSLFRLVEHANKPSSGRRAVLQSEK